MSIKIWLEKFGIIHMSPNETVIDNTAAGAALLMKTEMCELAEILKWLGNENIAHMVFWRWKPMIGEDLKFKPFIYYRLCPCVSFFIEEDAVRFKLTFGFGEICQD